MAEFNHLCEAWFTFGPKISRSAGDPVLRARCEQPPTSANSTQSKVQPMRMIPTTNPRRRPRQARAQATVEAIVKATARVLVEEGYDRASTNRIAHAAGVSIGSLYQYFPSKEALVAALVEHHQERMRDALDLALASGSSGSLTDRARLVVRGMIAAYRVDPQLHHVLCQEVPKVGELQKVYGF